MADDTCMDCGAVVRRWDLHAQFHATLNLHAGAIAVLKTSHLSEAVHDRYDAAERMDRLESRRDSTTYPVVELDKEQQA